MSWHYLPELAEEFLGGSYSAGEPSARWRKTRTAAKCSSDANATVCCRCSRSGTTSVRSTVENGMASWMSSRLVSLVSPSAAPANGAAKRTNGTFGPRQFVCFAKFDRASQSWKMYPSFFTTTISAKSSVTWKQQGLMLNGELYQRPALERYTFANDFGFVPTPTANRGGWNWGGQKRAGPVRYGLATLAHKGLLPNHPMGSLHPAYVEQLMGWPIGWTALEPLATDKFQQWLDAHGRC